MIAVPRTAGRANAVEHIAFAKRLERKQTAPALQVEGSHSRHVHIEGEPRCLLERAGVEKLLRRALRERVKVIASTH